MSARPALAILLCLALPGTAVGARSPAQQPTASVLLEDGLASVDSLEASVRPRDGKLSVTVKVAARATQDRTPLTIRLGACTGGTPRRPTCPATYTGRLTVGLAARTKTLRARVRRPGDRQDAIAVQVLEGSRVAARLIVPGEAARGSLAGRSFGVRTFAPGFVDVVSLRADGFAPRRETVRLGLDLVVQNYRSAPISLRSVTAPCDDGGCATRAEGFLVAQDVRGSYRERELLDGDGSRAWRTSLVSADTGDAVFTVRLPYPG